MPPILVRSPRPNINYFILYHIIFIVANEIFIIVKKMLGRRQTSDLYITGLHPSVAKDILCAVEYI